MRTGDGALFRRLCVRLTAALHSDYCGFTNTPIPELLAVAQEVKEAAKEFGRKKRRI